MDIVFCDLCNESVPLSDLQAGLAVRRGERVVCAACERAMTHGQTPRPSESAPLAPAVSLGSTAPARSWNLWMALGFVGLLAFVSYRSDERLHHLEDRVRGFSGAYSDLREDARQAQQERQALSAAVAALQSQRAEWERSAQAQQSALAQREAQAAQAVEAARGEWEQATQALRASLHAELATRERRIEELGMRLAKSEDQQRELLLAWEQWQQAQAEALVAREPTAPAPLPQEAAWQALLPKLQDENPSVRWQAIDELARAGDPAVLEALLPTLKDSDLFVRMRAASAIGELKQESSIPALIDALEDSEPQVREAACHALKLASGRDPKFDPLASETERAKRLRALREAWTKEAPLPKG